jgi:acetyltransferase-like isoleucine patch superfamily enzyme
VVRGNIPPYSIAVGVPAKVVRSRIPGEQIPHSDATGAD